MQVSGVIRGIEGFVAPSGLDFLRYSFRAPERETNRYKGRFHKNDNLCLTEISALDSFPKITGDEKHCSNIFKVFISSY